ncbi:ATP-dependent DNA helicase RecG [Radiobacillus kanasensis]|uniref:ATP-dependent DNA helicase RecG n=1 Tax=Radiobacillus kanasensis TaxID=2844358 RepID=UPI001E32E2AA|nr:ATP-dependent DNA helicase RecG [Radiobacillus kanasensis]UFU01363.1 ATP-dependent DNA helicase RecG [Radiobacillus kanasensis]
MLSDPVATIKGVGEKLEADLFGLGIETVEDLLFYFPFRYDIFEIKPLHQLIHEDKVTIEGKVIGNPSLVFYGKRKSKLSVNVQVENVVVKAVMFNRAFAKKQLQDGDVVTFTGKWDQHRLQITVQNYKKGPASSQNPIEPVYPLRGSVTNIQLKKLMKTALTQYKTDLVEIFPDSYLTSYKLPSRVEAIRQLHFPSNHMKLKHARRRFIYEEFLLFQLKMTLLRKQNRETTSGGSQTIDEHKVEKFIQTLPFPLTNAQTKSLKEILEDMKSPYRMNRLLQGDVGSGKTVVAAIGLYAAKSAGNQGALMVPTEILAEQHYDSLKNTFDDTVSIALLTGSVKGKKRKEILEKVAQKEIDILIGTHALIQEDVVFNQLGLVIVDEQHRFGVEQRRILRDKGLYPDVLFMTATPIPRTLAITAFGDMDVSIIDEMPAGRKEVKTYWAKENMLDRVLTFIQSEVEQGYQAYFICPLIEESDKLDIQNAVDLFHQLEEYYQPSIKVGLMHGRLHTDEKEEVMKAFANNDIQILVSTTVVEVGVNVPNATVMVIYDAERFGLSQLHQLRGRVGRGDAQSHCILIADPKGEVGKERMKIMTETSNGFELSEEDLKLRGPGDFFGKKQSGLPEFKIADMVHDYRALETARVDAQEIVSKQLLDDPSFLALKKILLHDPTMQGAVLD